MKIKKGHIFLLFFFCIIIFISALMLDLVHNGTIWNGCIINIYDELSCLFTSLGFEYDKALEILRGNIGVLVTTLSLILNMGVNIANRSEIKVFGIQRKELIYSLSAENIEMLLKQ